MTESAYSENSNSCSLKRNFSHLYIEREAAAYPDAERIRRQFPSATLVEIEDFKEFFNRPRQEWRAQKQSLKLIIAKKKDDYLYECSDVAPCFGFHHFYYNTLLMNCLYDCEYCYLQGMYPSANIVAFVNGEDYFTATAELLQRKKPLYLCISYDTDLLAFDHIIPYAARWIDFAAQHPDLCIEIRTKSANFSAIEHCAPVDNVILAWTLSPDEVSRQHERGAPGLKARLRAIARAQKAGWRVRLCFDPLLHVNSWRAHYAELMSEVRKELSLAAIRDTAIGVFRINADYLKRMRKSRSDSKLLHQPFLRGQDRMTYAEPLRAELQDFIKSNLLEWGINGEKIAVV